MNLEHINEMWEKDSKIDEIMLDESSLRIPRLHHKYLTFHSEFSQLARRKTQELKRLQHKKYLYYAGKASPEEYEEKPFPHKVMKGDVAQWISVDDDIMKAEAQLDYYNIILKTLEEILKQVNQLSYNIKNAISWRQFTGGV